MLLIKYIFRGARGQPTAKFELGVENKSGVSMGYSHNSHYLSGWPVNDEEEMEG